MVNVNSVFGKIAVIFAARDNKKRTFFNGNGAVVKRVISAAAQHNIYFKKVVLVQNVQVLLRAGK